MYEVVDLLTDESQGEYETLTEARGCVRYNRLTHYAIWKSIYDLQSGEFLNDVRVECCDPYEGDDDRVKQAYGLPNASEAGY